MSEGIIMYKKQLRKELVNKRNLIENKEEKSKIIADIFLGQEFYTKAQNIMVYSAINSEVSTDIIIKKLFLDKKTVIFPKCAENFRILSVEIDSENDLERGAYGILEPLKNEEFPKENIDLVIIPALSYDNHKNRLGYGAGYYDRFLSEFTGLKIGLCFSELFDKLRLPADEFDIKVDIIITDDGIY